MRRDVLGSFDFDLYPRQSFGAGHVVLAEGAPTDRLLVVLDGRLTAEAGGGPLGPGDIVKPVEFFGAAHYAGAVRADVAGQVVVIPRDAVRAHLAAEGALTWNLACAIAIEVCATAPDQG
jgi:CRP-like cAMP-binding protein